MRRIIDRHVTSPAINNLPIPDWSQKQIEQVAALAGELTHRRGIKTLPGGDQVPRHEEDRSIDDNEIIARIESIVADGFDLGQDELDTVLSDFSDKAASSDLRNRIQELFSSDTSDPVLTEQDDD